MRPSLHPDLRATTVSSTTFRRLGSEAGPSGFFRPATVGWVLALALLVLPMTASATVSSCIDGTPAFGVPQDYWGEIQPADVGQLPDARDSTDYDGSTPGKNFPTMVYNLPLFSSVDVEEGWAFVSYSYGFMIWDARGANAADPQRVSYKDGLQTGWASWPGASELREIVWDVDAPKGDSSIAVTAARSPVGVAIWDTANKENPHSLYQDISRFTTQVWASDIGGRDYAFAASEATTGNGLLVYDMTAARQYNQCVEDSINETNCPGVLLRGSTMAPGRGVSYVDGVKRANGKTYVAFSSGVFPKGVEIWDVSDPNNPKSLNLSGGLFATDAYHFGVALWEQGGTVYLATHTDKGGRVYDVGSCMDNGGCTSVGSPVWSQAWNVSAARRFVTDSESDGVPFIYFGEENKCDGGLQKEWLFDTSPLSQGKPPVDITPSTTKVVNDPETGQPVEIDYWGWYYARSPTGFSQVMPRTGVWNGKYFYRTAWTLFDVHVRGALTPTITITGPASGYVGDAQAFSANATSCTPDPSGWSWSTSGGTGAGSSSTASITWSSTGVKSVSATNTGCPGATIVPASISIASATPAIGSVTASPSNPYVCQPVTLTANDVTGRSPLTYQWAVTDGGSNPPPNYVAGTTNPSTWTIDPATTPGTYTAEATVSNSAGSAVKSTTINVQGLPLLPAGGTFAPTNDSFTNGTVQLHVNAPGATEWNWDFGDGSSTGWVSDPVSGPNPVHSYTALGAYTVTVQVRNCVEAARTSSGLAVNITQIAPLVAGFAAQCDFGLCGFNTGEAITFTDSSTGAELWDYDWNGDGTFEDAGHSTPVTSHTYSQTGDYYPKLRVHRGAETDVFTHAAKITVSTGAPPPPPVTPTINISGPTSGQVDTTYSFTAGATNCSPSASGWTWTTSGGVVSGSSSGATIQVSWPADGGKTLTAKNSACGTAVDSHYINIGGNTGGGGDLTAAFSYSPSTPSAGAQVTFDASGSTGGVEFYTWTFPSGPLKNGATATYTFQGDGTYNVMLEVGKRDAGCNLGICTATTSKTIVVGSGGGGGGLDATFTTNAECINDFGVNQCQAQTGQEVSFTATTEGATQNEWSFGDGTTATGKQVTHTWAQPGSYALKYTASSADGSDTTSRTFVVSGEAVAETHTVVLPWIAQADPDKALQQESDLYVHNPGPGPLTVEVTFRKQGLPEPDPPHVTRTLAENETLYLADVMTQLFNRPNIKGFLIVEPKDGEGQPIVTSFNRTHDGDRLYGQVITGVELTNGTSARAAGTEPLHLVGLNDTPERLGYFGITNPTDHRLDYELEFFDAIGRPIGGTAEPAAVAAFGQKQFQVEEIRQQFGVDAVEDYRVMVKPTEGSGQPIPFGANLRLGSKDPSFVRVGRTDSPDVFIVGALDSMGLNNSVFQSDLVMANTDDNPTQVKVTFTGVGAFTEPSDPINVTLPPRDTTRMVDIISQWDTDKSVGVLRLESNSPDGVYPVVQAESYEVSDPSTVYGQFMPGLTLADAASPGHPRTLVGLRQDADFLTGTRSTVWLYNPTDTSANYTIRYLALDGTELGAEEATLGAGKLRQVNPGFHPLPAEGAPDGFVVRVEVAKGNVLVAGQVVNEFNDPAYIVGR